MQLKKEASSPETQKAPKRKLAKPRKPELAGIDMVESYVIEDGGVGIGIPV